MAAGATNGRGPVVVTGASSGIGRACALALDRRGHRVFAGIRRQADADLLRASASERLTPLRIELTDAASIGAAAKEIEAVLRGAGLLGLVNNAGVDAAGPVEFLDLDELRHALEVNVIGPVALTQALLPALRRTRGRIVNVSSTAGRVASPVTASYSATKFAIEALSSALRQELRPFRLHVAVVGPGLVNTRIFAKALAHGEALLARMPAHGRRLYAAQIEAMQRYARAAPARAVAPERVAGAVLKALTARRPKTRYRVGLDAHGQALLRAVLPDRARDALIARYLGIERGGDVP